MFSSARTAFQVANTATRWSLRRPGQADAFRNDFADGDATRVHLDDPYGADLGRRGREHLAQLGWTIGAINPAATMLARH
jgi:hypothetical protein